jgi:ubiquinone/menaquinone biosynthesis C-methylase UbiE
VHQGTRLRLPGLIRRRLDSWLYRYPFEGRSASRYANLERPGFGDFDKRLIDELSPLIESATAILDVGAGPGATAGLISRRYPDKLVIAVEPSRAFTSSPSAHSSTVRAVGERLPLADSCIDVALSISAIRHVADRGRTFRELRRVVKSEGTCIIVELDPTASSSRIRAHTAQMHSRVSRLVFGPLVCRTAPEWTHFADHAHDAGFRSVDHRTDAVQPVYVLRLS